MIRTAVIGISGFGRVHLNSMRQMEKEGLACLVAAAQPPMPGLEGEIDALRQTGVAVYADWQEMLAKEHPDVVTIATPVRLHYAMASAALASGAHVFLEKPPVPNLALLEQLATEAKSVGRQCAVDFQMLSGGSTRALKELIVSGALGAVHRVAGIGLWKRLDVYYQSSAWHGRLKQDEEWSLAGPVANAMGHVMNQCLYFASPRAGFAWPERVEAEMYQAHPGIENEDTAAVRVHTDSGATAVFYPTFCAPQEQVPWIDLDTELAHVRWDYDRALDIRWNDGRQERREFGPEERIEHVKMFRNFFRTLRGEESLICPLSETRAFTAAVTGAYAAGTPVRTVSPAWVERVAEGNSTATLIRGIGDAITRAAAQGALFTEAGIPWA